MNVIACLVMLLALYVFRFKRIKPMIRFAIFCALSFVSTLLMSTGLGLATAIIMWASLVMMCGIIVAMTTSKPN